MIRSANGSEKEGPLSEEAFQDKLRAGKIPLSSMLKSNVMDDWRALLEVVSTDETFLRPSTMPPPPPPDEEG